MKTKLKYCVKFWIGNLVIISLNGTSLGGHYEELNA